VIEFRLDCQSILKIGFGFGLTITYLGWIQSKKIRLSNSLFIAITFLDANLVQAWKESLYWAIQVIRETFWPILNPYQGVLWWH
jgi:hypothetical protein